MKCFFTFACWFVLLSWVILACAKHPAPKVQTESDDATVVPESDDGAIPDTDSDK